MDWTRVQTINCLPLLCLHHSIYALIQTWNEFHTKGILLSQVKWSSEPKIEFLGMFLLLVPTKTFLFVENLGRKFILLPKKFQSQFYSTSLNLVVVEIYRKSLDKVSKPGLCMRKLIKILRIAAAFGFILNQSKCFGKRSGAFLALTVVLCYWNSLSG